MPKRIKLPTADQLLLGARLRKEKAPPAQKQKSTKAPMHQRAKVQKELPREHISTYLSTDLLKKLEEVRTHLFVHANQKLTKADLIKRAIRQGLRDPDELLNEE